MYLYGDRVAESQSAQKVKSRSSSSDQLTAQSSMKTGSSRRFDALSRKMRKDSVIDRLRKEKMNKVFALSRKLNTGCDPHCKFHAREGEGVHGRGGEGGKRRSAEE